MRSSACSASPFAEEDGGFGGGAVETMLIMEAFGRALALEPYLATVVLAGGAAQARRERRAARRADPANRVGRICASLSRIASASPAGTCSTWPRARARTAPATVLNGEKGLVIHGDSAHKLIVSARSAGGRRERGGLGLFLVDASAPGVARRGYPTQDGQRAAEITLTDVRVEAHDVVGDPEGAAPAIERVGRRGDRGAVRGGGRRDERGAWRSPSTTSRRASSSASPSARSRRCSTAPPTWWWRSNRRAA